MKKILFIIGLVATVLLAYYCVSYYSVKIEQDIETRLAESFDGDNISKNIKADVSGRDVILSGTVVDEETKASAYKTAINLHGVRAVNNQVMVVEPPPIIVPEPVASVIEEEPIFDLDIMPPVEDEDGVIENTEIKMAPLKGMSFDAQIEPDSEEIDADIDVTSAETDADPAPEVLPELDEEPEAVPSVEQIEDVEECQSELAGLLEKEKINFASGGSVVQQSSHDLLNRIASAAKGCKDSIITIHGYTDNSGDVGANVKLSLARAKSVGKYLISKGVRQEIRVVGNGPKDPVSTNDTDEGREQNRRIEFKVLKVTN